jgi:hypothetical protein
MVSAASRKISRIGIQRNNGRTSAMPRTKKVSTVKKMKSTAARNVPRKIGSVFSYLSSPRYG